MCEMGHGDRLQRIGMMFGLWVGSDGPLGGIVVCCSCRARMGDPRKESNRPNRDLIKKTLARLKNKRMSKYNAKLIKYSPQATKSLLWGAFGAPAGGFGGGGAVCHQFGIVYANLRLFSYWPGFFLIESRFGLFDCFLGSPI